MTELEKMQRAKMYMDKLANGIDPISDRKLPDDTALNNVRLSRCFTYISGILQQVIDNSSVTGRKQATLAFSLTSEQLARVPLSNYPLRITEFVEVLNQAAGNPEMKKLRAEKITNWLLLKGFLEKRTLPDGSQRRLPTEKGKRIGLSSRSYQGQDGEFQTVFYDSNAQRFILDNLEVILAEKS